MAPLSPSIDEAKNAASTLLWQVYHRRPRSRRAKSIAFSALTILLFLYMLLPSSRQPEPDFWTKFPSRHPFPERPEDAQVVLPQKSGISINKSLPHDLEKPNPYLHVLVHAPKTPFVPSQTRGVCRTLTSAMILGYPPPTLLGYGHENAHKTEFERMIDRITRVRNYLKNSKTINDHDFVLVVDALDVFFQLPPQILVERFQNILRTNNKKLQKKYGFAAVQNTLGGSSGDGAKRVLFGASKVCYTGLESDPGCVSVPESSLPPDVYGWKTDHYHDGHLNRPRWLNPGTVIGQAADLIMIYDEVLRLLHQQHKKNGDYQALTQMFGRQEVVRELERRRTASWPVEMFSNLLGIGYGTNISGISVRLETGHRYEYGIGVDYKSELFFNQIISKSDVEWLKYSNVTKSERLQMEMAVPRESRLLLPDDIAALPGPFNQTRFAKELTTHPEWNSTLDKLPNPSTHSWHTVPLMTNGHSATIPVLAHLNGDSKLRNTWWENMWFFPWARALLRRYVRSAHGFDAAQSALLGGQDWWDMRGGRGGIWTDDETWVPFSEICEGQERDLFDDDLGPWGKENSDPDEPVYNKFGNLIYGIEPEGVPEKG
ncbi:uncharacterized protein N7443_010521 [Penicillium atrosanguineum]|uniref:uncharacterized protein n=1 Tax=Penicillium atrosanguineum TaxID=1132637 RepID=UPI00238498DA|nr:uncharacterized protein N7443_010521 [Penicillium atrosanguineum]KAJ5290268.1 hypothetical protein N7443_010521 [Penicillium atrosanguineum]